jgi:hypothetical protein
MSLEIIAAFKLVNGAIELISAGQLVLSKLSERQAKREAEGKPITREDIAALMAEGDVQAAVERAQLVAAKMAQQNS